MSDIDTNHYVEIPHREASNLEVTNLDGSEDGSYDFPIPDISPSHVSNAVTTLYKRNTTMNRLLPTQTIT